MTTALAVQPKRVRGLSLLQKRIMAVAAKGWITPDEARECAYKGDSYSWDCEEPLKMLEARVAASASRALRRLVQRKLLTYEPARFINQSPAYRLVGYTEPLPWIESSHTIIFAMRSRSLGGGSPIVKTLKEFDQALSDRYKRLDTSLTKAEMKIGKRLNTPLTEKQQKMIAECVKDLASPERLNTSLTETPALPEDVSVEDGRKVLVGILQRQQLGTHKALIASSASDPVVG